MQLAVELIVTMQPAQGPTRTRIIGVAGKIVIGGPVAPNPPLVAALPASFVEWWCAPNQAVSNSVRLPVVLTHQQVRAIDEARATDGSLTLNVVFDAQVDGVDGVRRSTQDKAVVVTASDWSRILREMQFEDRVTFEVPVEGGRVGPPLDKAAAHMRAALDQLQQRHWDDALVKCREVLTDLQQFQRVPGPSWADWSDKAKREAWSLQERVVALHAALRHVTHAGAHAAIGAPNEHEVRLAVTMTGALLRYHASL